MDDLNTSFGLLGKENDAQSGGAWDSLAETVGMPGGNAADIAERVNKATDVSRYAPAIHAALNQLLFESGQDGATDALERASDLAVALKPAALGAVLVQPTGLSERRKLIVQAVNSLRPDAVNALAMAAGVVYDRPVSAALNGLLKGLEQETSTLTPELRPIPDRVFRSLVLHIIDRWTTSRVDSIATGFDDLFQQIETKVKSPVAPEAERVVQLALETGAVGAVLWSAVAEMSEGEGQRKLLGMLRSAPRNSRAADVIGQQFANPQRLSMLLREDEVDFDVVDALLKYMGLVATDTLLEALVTSHSRDVRRGILDRLIELGPRVGPVVINRLKDQRWFVIRNMLHVLRETGADVTDVNLVTFQSHGDPRVRREATELLFKVPAMRDKAMAMAIKDGDPHLIRAAFRAARNGLPESTVPLLAKRMLEKTFPPEFRLPAIQLLGRSKSVLALDALLRFVNGGTTLLGKQKLAPRSPEMLAALKGLARSWSTDRRGRMMLDLAISSRDDQTIAAAQPPAPAAPEDEFGVAY